MRLMEGSEVCMKLYKGDIKLVGEIMIWSNLVISTRDKCHSESFYSLYYETVVIKVPKGLVLIWGRPLLRGVAFCLIEDGEVCMKLYRPHHSQALSGNSHFGQSWVF